MRRHGWTARYLNAAAPPRVPRLFMITKDSRQIEPRILRDHEGPWGEGWARGGGQAVRRSGGQAVRRSGGQVGVQVRDDSAGLLPVTTMPQVVEPPALREPL